MSVSRRAVLAAASGVIGATVLRPVAARAQQPAGTGSYELRNGFVELIGSDGDISSLRFDPDGRGQYRQAQISRVGIGPSTGTLNRDLRWHRRGDQLVLENVKVAQLAPFQQADRDSAPKVEPGHTLGQSFTVTKSYFSRVGAFAATYTTSDSGVTLRLRAGGPSGSVVAEQALTDMSDNAWAYLAFDPQPAGVYYLEMAQPIDSPAWWTSSDGTIKGGSAYVDGAPVAGARTLDITEFDIAVARWTLQLAGPKLRTSYTAVDGTNSDLPSPVMVTAWNSGGYGVAAADGVPFSRFVSDTGQYLSAHVLKRRTSGVPALGIDNLAHFTGTGSYDLDLTVPGATMSQSMTQNAMTLSFDGASGELDIEVLRQGSRLPAPLPVVDTGDATFDTRLNEFLPTFTFCWGVGGFSATWFEWVALARMWTATDLASGFGANITDYHVDPDGYVWSWGDLPYWPLDDPHKFDTRHFDNNACYILGAWRYFSWTGDEHFLSAVLPKLRSAMDYQLGTLNGADGLLRLEMDWHRGRPQDYASNYWDDLPFGFLDAYDNIYFFASLGALAELEEHVGASERAAQLRMRAGATRRAYNATFWDDSAGRYITTIDSDGVRWDRGCTFLNTEAASYGLATPAQVERIYAWMEDQPTSAGQADTFSRYVFAPRANTIDMGKWWYLDGKGSIPRQPYGSHLENGGAILYTTGFDVMARARYLGADNAYRRLSAVLARFSDPDHLCGGPPLYRGENTGWEVGTDIPFPESGVAGVCAIYAFLGLEGHPDRLVIAPNLPSVWSHMRVSNVGYHGHTFTITATHGHVLIERADGRRAERDYRPGERLAFDGSHLVTIE